MNFYFDIIYSIKNNVRDKIVTILFKTQILLLNIIKL